MNPSYSLQGFRAQFRPEVQPRTRPQPSNAHPDLSTQSDHHPVGDGSGFRHGHQTSRPSHDELSSFTMSAVSAVPAVDFETPELHPFSDMFKTTTRPDTQSVIPISHPELNVSPTPLLLYEPPLPLTGDRSGINPQLFGTRRESRPQKQMAEGQGPIHSGSSRFLPHLLAGTTDSSVGNMRIFESAAPVFQTTGAWGHERGALPDNLPGESVGPPASLGMKGPARGITGDQEEQTGRPGSDGALPALKLVENPPDLAKWRRKLFDLETMVVLTQEE